MYSKYSPLKKNLQKVIACSHFPVCDTKATFDLVLLLWVWSVDFDMELFENVVTVNWILWKHIGDWIADEATYNERIKSENVLFAGPQFKWAEIKLCMF